MDLNDYDSTDPIHQLIKEVEKVEIQDREKRIQRDIQHHKRTSKTDRIKNAFLENPDKSFRPSDLTTLLKIKPSTIRSRLAHLKVLGIIRNVWDSRRGKFLYGYYELNRAERIYTPTNAGPLGIHGIKIEIRDPKHQFPNKRKNINGIVPAKELYHLVLTDPISKDFFHFTERYSQKDHIYLFHGSWHRRKITLTINKSSSLVEIWNKCTKDTLSPQEYIDYDKDLNLLFGDIYTHSDPKLTQFGINHDQPYTLIEGLEQITCQAFRDYFVRVYQKGTTARMEAHSWRSMSQYAVVSALNNEILEQNKLFDKIELEDTRKELSKARSEITLLRENFEKLLDSQDSQETCLNEISEIVSEYPKILARLIENRQILSSNISQNGAQNQQPS